MKNLPFSYPVKTRTQGTLGRYEIEAEIGRGAMGVVYRARDPKIDRWVAIKTICLAGQESADEQEYRERFLEEARAAGRLSHPGIVTIFDAAEDLETREPYLVMEYVSGQPLSNLMPRPGGQMEMETALRFVLEIAEALNYAHSQGVIHRDIKPANILVTDDGHAKIADFGVARLNYAMTTHTGQIFGSPAYMAPEQLMRGQSDARSDLFSVGVMLYSMLTGFRPFQGNSAETVCFKVMNVEPVPVTSFQTTIHPALDRVVLKAIAKEPDDRYQTGAQLANDIREFLSGNDIEHQPSEPLPHWATHSTQSTSQLQLFDRGLNLKQFLWRAAAGAAAVAAVLTAFQVRNEIHEAANILPPAPLVISAPSIAKTPVKKKQRERPQDSSRQAELRRTVRPIVPPAPAPAPIKNARMHMEILHHFAEAKASIAVDDKVVFSEDLHQDGQRHSLLRSLEMDQVATFEIPAGKHQLKIHVITPDRSYDQIENLDTELDPGSQHILEVNCDKRKMLIRMEEAASKPTAAPAASAPAEASTLPAVNSSPDATATPEQHASGDSPQ